MTRGRKRLLVVVAVVVLAPGGFAWYWHATAVDRRVRALLDEVHQEEPGLVERWLIKLGLAKERPPELSYHEVVAELRKLGPSAVPELIRALRDSSPNVRGAAAEALGRLGDARAVEPLIAALKDQDPSVRWHPAEALGKLGDARAIKPLMALLDDRSGAGSQAVDALGELGAPAFEPLIAALKDEDGVVRRYAAQALAKLGDRRAIEPLLELWGDEVGVVRVAAADAIAQLRRQRGGKP